MAPKFNFLSLPAVAEILGASVPTVKSMVKRGEIPTVIIGQRKKVEESRLLAWIASGGASSLPVPARALQAHDPSR